MMRKLYVLKKNDVALARDEIAALYPRDTIDSHALNKAERSVYPEQQFGNLLVRSATRDLSPRLALTRSIHDVLFICRENEIHDRIFSYDFGQRPKSFYVDAHGSRRWMTAALAKIIGEKLQHPFVDTLHPTMRIDIFFESGVAIVTKNAQFIHHDFESRKAHLRPAHHPSALHPMMARALVNLTGVWNETLVDPMCGAGGFLIEAGLMEITCRGYDIDKEMIRRAKTNLEYYGVHAILMQLDVLNLHEELNTVVTDLPYGRSTKCIDRDELYPQFLAMLKKNLRGRAIVVFPNYGFDKRHILAAKLHILAQYDLYVHKTLTRKICVLV